MSGKSKPFFPTLLYTGKFANAATLNRRLLKDIETFAAQDQMGQEWSEKNYRGGYTSYGSLCDMHFRSPSFSEFAELLQKEADKFAKDLRWDMRGLRLEMTACWMNIMPEGTYHTLHLHPHSVLSGAYYVNAPKGSVALKIEDPRMPYYMNAPVKKAGKDTSLYQQIEPSPGSFVLFESWVRHEVPPNTSKIPRVSISFNYSLEEN